MHGQLESHARYLAYRWWRLNDPAASHCQGWEFANKNWPNFLFEAKKRFNLQEEELGLLDDGNSWCVKALAQASSEGVLANGAALA